MKIGLTLNVNMSQLLKMGHMKECNKETTREMPWRTAVYPEERKEAIAYEKKKRKYNGNNLWNLVHLRSINESRTFFYQKLNESQNDF
jgi:hypothetical protein